MKNFQVMLIISTILVVLAVVGTADHQEEVAQQDHYTDMVCGKWWPNYKNLEVKCDE